jgi:hypothetical protein
MNSARLGGHGGARDRSGLIERAPERFDPLSAGFDEFRGVSPPVEARSTGAGSPQIG